MVTLGYACLTFAYRTSNSSRFSAPISIKYETIDKIVLLTEGFSGAELKAVCTESGYFAIRNKRTKVIMDDIMSAISKIKQEENDLDHANMFG